MNLNLFKLLFGFSINKETCAVGYHQHPQIMGCHLISQHHRFQHKDVTDAKREFTVPEKYWEHPDYIDEEGDDPEILTETNVSTLARAYGILPNTLSAVLKRELKGVKEDQFVETEEFDEKGNKIRFKELLLTPAQLEMAHEIAANVKRRAQHRHGIMTITRPEKKPSVVEDFTELFSNKED